MTNWHIRQAARSLHAGGVIAYPTETVYGLGCAPLDEQAVEKILDLKQRPIEKGLILIASSFDQLMPFVDVPDTSNQAKVQQIGPTPTTWVVPASPYAPRWISGKHNSVAVRLCTGLIARQLCDTFGGAIVSTSANPAGLPPACNALKVRAYFQNKIDYIISGNTPPNAQPSQIKRLSDGKILRGGNS